MTEFFENTSSITKIECQTNSTYRKLTCDIKMTWNANIAKRKSFGIKE